jgi:hypothetical protein
VGNWTDTIRVPFRPNGTSRLISSESQIPDLIAEIQQMNYSRIMVVGRPALAQAIYDRLSEAGINATLVQGGPERVAVQIMRSELIRIRLREEAVRVKIRETERRMAAAGLNNTEAIIQRVDAMLRDAGVSQELRTRIISSLEDMQQEMAENYRAGNYTRAFNFYVKIKDSPDMITMRYRDMMASAYRDMEERGNAAVNTSARLAALRDAVNRRGTSDR